MARWVTRGMVFARESGALPASGDGTGEDSALSVSGFSDVFQHFFCDLILGQIPDQQDIVWVEVECQAYLEFFGDEEAVYCPVKFTIFKIEVYHCMKRLSQGIFDFEKALWAYCVRVR